MPTNYQFANLIKITDIATKATKQYKTKMKKGMII